MSEWVVQLPWWGWTLLGIGALAVVMVFSALFLPDWNRPEALHATFDAPAGSEAFVTHLARFLNVPVLRGGEATILQNGNAFLAAMLDAIRSARETVNFQVYIFEPEGIGAEFLEAFKERARAGVEVRVMVDAFGSLKLDGQHRRALREAGCRVARFRPLRVLTLVRAFKRDHRRAIVVDGRVGFTGGGSIAQKWTGNAEGPDNWRDNMTRVTGPLAAGVQTAFGENWVSCTGEVVAGPRFYPQADGLAAGAEPAAAAERGPGGATGGAAEAGRGTPPLGLPVVSSPSDAYQPIRVLFWLSFRSARERIYVSSSYFIPSRHLREAIKKRARQGVDVRILVPGRHTDAKPVRLAGRTFYEELLEAGVRIFEYRHTMMHAKTVVVDGVWSLVGSANMDERSVELNEEFNLGVADARLATEIERGILADFEVADEIQLEAWRRRSRIERVKERLAKLLIEQY